MSDGDLYPFFERFAGELRARGVLCAITSGLACVHYGIAETTQDCDLLCHAEAFGTLLDLLASTTISGESCRYRGNISPPLDSRWHRGGWTSHFEWRAATEVFLDVFGHALRESSPWTREAIGLSAGPHTVAEMKRTQRDKDWPFVTALGVRLLEAGDSRGWLHIFDAETLANLLEEFECPAALADSRPALGLALNGDRRIAGALNAERKLWEELDRSRIRLFEQKLRPYVTAIRKGRAGVQLSFQEDHALRVESAQRWLPERPLLDYGLDHYVEEAKKSLVESRLIPEDALAWLPDVIDYFSWLTS